MNKIDDYIYTMALHERIQMNNRIWIMRVPGGWLYEYHDSPYSADVATTTFVPFSNEFQITE